MNRLKDEVFCLYCKIKFFKRKDLIKINNNHYCSKKCKRIMIRKKLPKNEFLKCSVCFENLHYNNYGRRYEKEVNGRIRNSGRLDINGDSRKYHCKKCDYKIIKNKHENDPSYRLFLLARRRTKKKGLNFDLTKEFVKKLWEIDNKICPILKEKYVFGIKKKDLNPSIDRFDNNKGYVKGNIKFISHKANAFKGNITNPDIFLNLYNYMKKKI